MMVSNGDNVEKYEGKHMFKDNSVLLLHLVKGGTYIRLDCKNLNLVKLWYCKQISSVANQIIGGLEVEDKLTV